MAASKRTAAALRIFLRKPLPVISISHPKQGIPAFSHSLYIYMDRSTCFIEADYSGQRRLFEGKRAILRGGELREAYSIVCLWRGSPSRTGSWVSCEPT